MSCGGVVSCCGVVSCGGVVPCGGVVSCVGHNCESPRKKISCVSGGGPIRPGLKPSESMARDTRLVISFLFVKKFHGYRCSD